MYPLVVGEWLRRLCLIICKSYGHNVYVDISYLSNVLLNVVCILLFHIFTLRPGLFLDLMADLMECLYTDGKVCKLFSGYDYMKT